MPSTASPMATISPGDGRGPAVDPASKPRAWNCSRVRKVLPQGKPIFAAPASERKRLAKLLSTSSSSSPWTSQRESWYLAGVKWGTTLGKRLLSVARPLLTVDRGATGAGQGEGTPPKMTGVLPEKNNLKHLHHASAGDARVVGEDVGVSAVPAPVRVVDRAGVHAVQVNVDVDVARRHLAHTEEVLLQHATKRELWGVLHFGELGRSRLDAVGPPGDMARLECCRALGMGDVLTAGTHRAGVHEEVRPVMVIALACDRWTSVGGQNMVVIVSGHGNVCVCGRLLLVSTDRRARTQLEELSNTGMAAVAAAATTTMAMAAAAAEAVAEAKEAAEARARHSQLQSSWSIGHVLA